ncbi:helix-turn-helix domain-containing protein [Pseudalkalibacillus sp. SCS-8]|uniref:ArsR/SmtB family transcription factor n=1 Tax=Pseudalkalibacillus nanhaiensis TaxID=3115291 RepID=UPI0032DA799F
MDNVFKALADGSRRQLLDQLYTQNGQTLSELCEHLDMSRQAVTKHLHILEEADLIKVLRQGRTRLHYLNTAPISEIYERWISKYDRHRIEALKEMKIQLEEEKDD